ncbi:MAG TPA: carboxypeptidase regulatory-like domain-containing protein [Gemmatimonadaceae bacterium]|nr:carboxypeptidase regulatory-like domain-containing protein [Gemmatimonadaceae bacterium]
MRLPSLSVAVGALLLASPVLAQRPTSRPKITPSAPAPAAPAPSTIAPAPGSTGPLAGSSTMGYLQGVAIDSIHDTPLVNAMIQLSGTDRVGITDSLGRFLVDSITPGSYKVDVDHPILDTLGIMLSTAPMQFVANEVTRVVIAIPSQEFLAGRFCTPARRALGPGVLAGRVREPDSEVAAVGARVSLVWYDPDPPIVAGVPVKIKKAPRVREATVGEDGTYRLCGLPEKYEGKLQAQRKDGGTTAEVSITQEDGLLALRSMSVSPLPVAAGTDSAGKPKPALAKGSARVLGRVVNNRGAPVGNARVTLNGTGAATLTRENGEFVLDSLPAGTQAVTVRHLGYAQTEKTVELSSRTPARVTVEMGPYVPVLETREVVSRQEQGLERVGWTTRKRGASTGYFIGPEQIEARRATQFTDLLTTTPGIRVQGTMGRMSISATRTAGRAGCVNVYVDGSRWQQLEAGDLDSFVRAQDVAAIEVYPGGGSMPVEFQSLGGDCAAVVVWTKLNVNRRAK